MYETEQRTQLVVRQNVTFDVELVVLHDNQPFDFTDYTVGMQWRRGGQLALDASSTGTDPRITIEGNVVTITVPPAALTPLAPGRYDFDVIATGPDHVWQLAVGHIDLRRGITQEGTLDG